jgi:carbamoyltransferase
MTILGLNAYHADSAACLMVDGKLVAAATEECLRRTPHWAGLPTNAIDYCLREAQLTMRDVDLVAINRKPGKSWSRLGSVLRHRPHPKLIWQNLKSAPVSIQDALEKHYGPELKAKLRYVEHHLAHLASAFLVSPFREAACLSLDGFGDFTSAAMGFGHGERIKIGRRVRFPHSLGVFYSALTQFLGFPDYGDEEKLMELASSGEPAYLDQLREIVPVRTDGMFRLDLRYFRHQTGSVAVSTNDCAPELGTLYRKELANLLGAPRKAGEPLEQRHRDIARSVQTIYEKAFFALLGALHKKHPSDYLVLAGGCALNAVANGKVYRRTPFKKMYVQPAPGAAGGAIGAAVYVNSLASDGASRFILNAPYLGPESTEQEIHALLDWRKNQVGDAGCGITYLGTEEELLRWTAQAIDGGKVVAWFQGRMEWGPHSLGNRSILADPRRANMKEILDSKIKTRASIPAGAAILRESLSEWFEQEDDLPFMTHIFQVRAQKQSFIPAAVRADGSAWLHTVQKEANPRFHRLLEHFRDLSGIPVLLNAALSSNGSMVCYPEEALDCFLASEIDLLVLGNFLIERSNIIPIGVS